MDSERWRQVERLYHAALEREGSRRAAFLQEACGGDHELRREVESLLASGAAAGVAAETPHRIPDLSLRPNLPTHGGTRAELVLG